MAIVWAAAFFMLTAVTRHAVAVLLKVTGIDNLARRTATAGGRHRLAADRAGNRVRPDRV